MAEPKAESLAIERKREVDQTLADIKAIAAREGITYRSLDAIAARLKTLAARGELFPQAEFPSPATRDAEASTRYLLRKDADDTFALYLNSINPGKNTVPHNHTTWAVIVAVDGEELNRVYKRVDDGASDDHAELELDREVLVAPAGNHVAFLSDDIHSIHVEGDASTRHFHLYGLALERLTERVGYDLQNKRVINYNKNYHSAKSERVA
jgi:predicted metal-dependent enzyme (double-stranded beta helix superfamily)